MSDNVPVKLRGLKGRRTVTAQVIREFIEKLNADLRSVSEVAAEVKVGVRSLHHWCRLRELAGSEEEKRLVKEFNMAVAVSRSADRDVIIDRALFHLKLQVEGGQTIGDVKMGQLRGWLLERGLPGEWGPKSEKKIQNSIEEKRMVLDGDSLRQLRDMRRQMDKDALGAARVVTSTTTTTTKDDAGIKDDDDF